MPSHLDKFRRNAKTFGDFFRNFDVEARQLAVFIMKRKRRVSSLRTDFNFTASFNLLEQILRRLSGTVVRTGLIRLLRLFGFLAAAGQHQR